MVEHSKFNQCRNCGADLRGEFCHDCGQSSTIVRRPSWDLLNDALAHLFHWDGRLLRTLKQLFLHPGVLALEWVRGRRMKYVPPFRLYVISSFILFLLIGLSARHETGGDGLVSVSNKDMTQMHESLEKAEVNGKWFEAILLRGTIQALEDPAAYRDKILTNLPKAAFLLLPVLALMHMTSCLRAERYFIDYLVYSLHFHAYTFLVISVVMLIGFASNAIGGLLGWVYLWIPVHGVMGFKAFNEQGWGKSILKGFLVFGGYSVLLVLGIALYFATALFL